jgi:tetratricopeptide (TPR) repeat protein
LDEIKAHALNNMGSARDALGDPQGVANLEQAVAIAEALNSPEVARAINNLAAAYDTRGEISRAREMYRRGFERARELGNRPVERFIAAVVAHIDYAEGNWERTLEWVDRFIEEAEAAGGHAQEAIARADRGEIRLARGDLTGAEEDARRAEESARRAGDPQALAIGLSNAAALEWELGRTERARSLAYEVLDVTLAGDQVGLGFVLWIYRDLGREALDRIVAITSAGGWRDLFVLIGEGRLVDAARQAESLLSLPAAATMHQAAARQLIAAGDHAGARAELDLAVAFWEKVGAERYLGQAQELYDVIDAAEGAPTATG